MKKDYLEPLIRIADLRMCIGICISAGATNEDAVFDEDLDIL